MRSWILMVVAALTVLAASAVDADQTTRITMILVNRPEVGWPEQDLCGKLERLLSSRSGFELVEDLESELLAQEVEGRFQEKRLTEWGVRSNCHYILWFDITREELAVERGLNIPFLVNQKRVTANLDLDYRVLDCLRGRLVHADKISKRRHGPSAMQLVDDINADPGLHLSYLERRQLFEKLEEDAVTEIFAELERIARQR